MGESRGGKSALKSGKLDINDAYHSTCPEIGNGEVIGSLVPEVEIG